MDEEREKKSCCEREKYSSLHMKKINQVFDGGQKNPRLHDCGDHSELSNIATPGSSLSLFTTPTSLTSTGDDECGMLMAEGMAAQIKRLGLQTKAQSYNYIDFLIGRIKELEEGLANRNMVVNALKRELDMVKDTSVVDATAGPLLSASFSPDSGNTTHRSPVRDEDDDSLRAKLMQKEAEVTMLQDQLRIINRTKSEAQNEKLSNQIIVLESEVKEQADTIDELNLEIVQKTKLLCRVQDQLQKKSEDFGKQNMKTSLEIKQLMKNVEELGREVRNKDSDLKQAKEELTNLRSEMQRNFILQLAHIKEQLMICHDEEKDELNSIHDDVLKQFMQNHETEVSCYKKQIEALNNRIIEHSKTERELEAELEACRLAYEAQINSYKECVENLMEELSAEKEKNEVQYKKQIEKYKNDLKKYKNEIEKCSQQIKNFDNKVAEEVRHVEEKYAEQCEQFRVKCEAQIIMYKNCAESLKQKEQMTSEEAIAVELKLNKNIDDLTKELQLSKEETDSINVKLRESQKNESETEEQLQKCKVELENYVERCNSLNETCSTLQDTCKTLNDNYNSLNEKCNSLKEKCASFSEVCNQLNERCTSLNEQLLQKESNEEVVSAELQKYQSMINEYQTKLKECEEKFNSEIATVEEKREEEVDSLRSQVNHLISTLDEVKSSHEREIGQAVEQMMRQNEQLESLRIIADCDSVEGVVQKLTEHKTKTIEIDTLNDKLKCATNSLCNYETRLTELRKCYEDDVCLYKNQIEKLKDELQNASSLEESVVRQLNNHMSGVKESKEQIKDILLRKDIQVYLLENNPSCNNFTDTSSSTRVVSSNTNKGFSETNELSEDDLKLLYIKLDDLNTENNLLKQELDSLKKPKCNVSIKPHGNVVQKRHIEQALFDELEKELHDCKIDNESKLQDIEELIKENNDLADHYNKLEAQFRELKEFTAQKLDEMQLLQNEKENLFKDRMQLENNQMMLIAKLESLTEEADKKPNSARSLPEEEEEEEADLNLQSGGHLNEKAIKKLFKHAATSTPNFDENGSDEIERDLVTPKRKIMDSNINSNELLSKWVTTCNEFENENAHLKKEIDRLNFKIKEMECCSETIKAEISAFDKNCEALKDRIFELESKKIALRELEHVNEQLKLRNEKLEEDRHILRSEVANLKEENLNLERKHSETVANLLSQKLGDKGSGNEAYENLILELNKKSEEVLILKEELCVKQETNTSIQDELHQLLQIRNEMSAKLQLVTEDLKVAEAEITKLRQERLSLGLEKKLADKKLNVIKIQNEQLLKHFNEKLEKDSDSNGVINIVEELEKELIELHKNLSEERGVIERMAVEKNTNRSCGNGSEDSGTSYKIELLLNAFEQLQYEKEGLKKKTIELQDIINKYVDNNEIDESWKLEVKESQKRLISELETYGKQRADLGKNLLESEDLRLKVELAERELLLKIEEKTKIENLLAEERQGLCNALNRISFLEKQLCEKMHVLQVMGEEKVDLQGNLWALQEKLCGLEEHLQQQKLILEGEIQERELRVRHAQLELHAAQLDKNALINKMLLEAEAETEMERVSYLREELEKEHNLAITRLKRLYSSQLHDVIEQASAQQQNVEQRHHNQVISPFMMTTPNSTSGSISMPL